MAYFCSEIIGPEGRQCGLRITGIGKCAEHDPVSGHDGFVHVADEIALEPVTSPDPTQDDKKDPPKAGSKKGT